VREGYCRLRDGSGNERLGEGKWKGKCSTIVDDVERLAGIDVG
jgi:hypothetical protein